MAPTRHLLLASYLPRAPKDLAVYDAGGKLYVVVHEGWATGNSSIVVINADITTYGSPLFR